MDSCFIFFPFWMSKWPSSISLTKSVRNFLTCLIYSYIILSRKYRVFLINSYIQVLMIRSYIKWLTISFYKSIWDCTFASWLAKTLFSSVNSFSYLNNNIHNSISFLTSSSWFSEGERFKNQDSNEVFLDSH